MGDNVYNDMMPVFHKRSGLIESTVEYLENNRRSLSLPEVRSCLSIGPGTGDLDLPILRCLPKLNTYTGIESNDEACDLLKKRVEDTFTQVTTTVHADLWNDWCEKNDSDEKYDLILILHVIYLIPDKHKLLEQCRQYLTPNGHVVVGFCMYTPDSTFGSIMNNYTEKTAYLEEGFKADLKLANINEYNLDIMTLELDLTCRDDTCMDMMIFFGSIELPNNEMRSELNKFYPNEKGIHYVMMASYGAANK